MPEETTVPAGRFLFQTRKEKGIRDGGPSGAAELLDWTGQVGWYGKVVS